MLMVLKQSNYIVIFSGLSPRKQLTRIENLPYKNSPINLRNLKFPHKNPNPLRQPHRLTVHPPIPLSLGPKRALSNNFPSNPLKLCPRPMEFHSSFPPISQQCQKQHFAPYTSQLYQRSISINM